MNSPAPIRPLSTFGLGFDDVHDAVLLPDDDTLVVCAEPDPRLHLVSLDFGSRRTVSGHNGPVNTLALADDGRLLVSGSDDGSVRVWDTETWATKLVLEGHTDFVRDVAAAGMVAASGSEDRTVRVWDLADGTCRTVFDGHEASVDIVAVSPDGAMVVSASTDNHVMVWDLNTGTGRDLYRSGQRLWNIDRNTGVFGGSFVNLGRNESGKGHDSRPSAMLFGADSDTLYTTGDEVIVWNLTTGTETARSESREQPIRALARHPESGLLAAATWSQISMFSPDAEYRYGFGAEQDSAQVVVFTGDGRPVSIDMFGKVSAWPAPTGSETDGLRHRGMVTFIAMDPTGRRAATVDSDNEVMVWELATGRRETALVTEGLLGRPGQLAFTPDGRRLVISTRLSLEILHLDSHDCATVDFDMDPQDMWFSDGFTVLDDETVFVTADTVPPALISLSGQPPRPMTGRFAKSSGEPVVTPDKRYALTEVKLKSGDPLLHNPTNVAISPLGLRGLQCWDLTTGEPAWTRHAHPNEHPFRGYGWFFAPGDGTVLTTDTPGGTPELLVLDLATGDIRNRFPAPVDKTFAGPPHRLADGNPGFFIRDNRAIRLWMVTAQGLVPDLRFAIPLAEDESAWVELVIPGADLVITRDRNKVWFRYRLSTGEQLSRPDISREANVVAASPDGSTIVVGDATGYVHIVPAMC